ncbi:MAG: transcription termination factor NusA [Fimbriiglobus sp.]
MAKAKLEPVISVEEKKRTRAKDLLKLVDLIQEEKKISRDIVFNGIESAIRLASERHFNVDTEAGESVYVHIDRATGDIVARHKDHEIDPETLGRIAAQSAKQVMIQKVREAESDTVYSEYHTKKGELIVGTITRIDAGTAIVSLGKTEALLPRSEQIPGETHHVGERVKAVVYEVRKAGQRVKIILSRAHEDFVRTLFNEEIPEVDDRTIDIRNVAREPGYRSKVAVSSIDSKVDCVGACVGVRGSRIKNIIEELNGERIDIVRWNESLQILIPNALSPAEISDVFTYPRLGRAIVLVNDDQLSLAIGRRGQNVRLASKLVGMDLEIMTPDELGEALERAERWFRQLPGVTEEQVQRIVEEGFLSYNELTYIDAEELLKFVPEMTEEVATEIIDYAEEYADHMERASEEERAESIKAAAELRAAAEAEANAAEEASANPDTAEVSESASEAPSEESSSNEETPPSEGETDVQPETQDGATA